MPTQPKTLKSKTTGKELIDLEKRLYEYAGDDRIVTSAQKADELRNAKRPPKYPTGIKTLDRILDSVEEGELITLLGPSGVGKTELMVDITRRTAEQVRSLWFNLEITEFQFMDRFNFTPPMFYLPNQIKERDIYWIEERIIEAKLKHNIRYVFLDNLGALYSSLIFNNKFTLELGDLVQKIKDICTANHIVIWQVHHITPDVKERGEPSQYSGRDSKRIADISDIVLAYWRCPNDYDLRKPDMRRCYDLDENDTRCVVKIAKSRRSGMHKKFFLDFNREQRTYYELDEFRKPPQDTKPIIEEEIGMDDSRLFEP